MVEVKEIEREGTITSPDGEEFTIKQEGRKIMVKIPQSRRIDETPKNLWVTDSIHSDENKEEAVIRICMFIIETYPKK